MFYAIHSEHPETSIHEKSYQVPFAAMKTSELIDRLKQLSTVYGDLEIKLWPCRDEGNYRDCTVIVSGVDNKVFLIDEDTTQQGSKLV